MTPNEHALNGSGRFTSMHLLNASFSRKICRDACGEVMGSPCTDRVRVERENENQPYFVEIVQIYRDKTATILKANATNAYLVHVTLLNFG